MVLTGPPDPAAHAMLARISGLPAAQLDRLYWANRLAYDDGSLTGHAFWSKVAGDAHIHLAGGAIDQLVTWDARMWMTANAPMLAWQLSLKNRGLLTAIVSNMGDTVHHAMERELNWLSRFDVLVWSYQLHIAKPDPAIYRYALERLGARPEETLFIDDRPANVEAANALGMRGAMFTTVEKLREDLIASGLEKELPLPE